VIGHRKDVKMSPRKRPAVSKAKNANETPDHSNELLRLSRIRGQIDGIEKMIKDGRYCPDIMNQVKSATSALRSVEKQLMQRHLKHCVKEAMASGNERNSDMKIRELMELFDR
jgi:DNA-binding FrmR family transcriptional regulator